MSIETGALAAPTCLRCGAALAIAGVAAGTWLACPSCGRPFRVEGVAAAPVRPQELAPPAPKPAATVPERPRRRPRLRRSPTLILALVSGLSTLLFAGLFLPLAGLQELLGAGIYGGLLGLFVATMAASAARSDDRSFPADL
jgi:hypothetical protein